MKANSFIKQVKQSLGPLIKNHRKKLMIGGGIAGLILLIFLIASPSDPQELVKEFELAVATGDVDTVESMIDLDGDLEMDEKRIKQFVDHMQKNEKDYMELTWLLNAQAAHHAESDDVLNYATDGMTVEEMMNAGTYYVKKTEIPLLPDQYSIGVRPYYLQLKTTEPGVKVKVDGEKAFTSKKGTLEKRYGPVMPGIYKVDAKKKFEYADLSTSDEINIFDEHTDKKLVSVDLELIGETIEVESNVGDTLLFVNGKKVGKVEKFEAFGPVSKNGTITLHGEQTFPWGKGKSEKVSVDENTTTVDVTPDPFSEKNVRKQIVQLINNYAKQYVKAHKTQNADVYTTLTDSLKNDEAEEIASDKEFERTYKGKAIGTRIDFGSYEFKKDEETDRYQVEITVEFHKKERTYRSWDDGDEPLEEKIFQNKVTLLYFEEKKKWLIAGFDYDFGQSEMEGKEVVKSEFK